MHQILQHLSLKLTGKKNFNFFIAYFIYKTKKILNNILCHLTINYHRILNPKKKKYKLIQLFTKLRNFLTGND